jgi:hypothetical protein
MKFERWGARTLAIAGTVLAILSMNSKAAAATAQHESQIARGEYLVKIIGCSDCHTPEGFTPKPDASRYLAGSDVDIVIAGMGSFVPSNLTPDKATGLGTWTIDQIATAITTGVTPNGRILSPAMPWTDFGNLSKSDAMAIALYLKSIPAVPHKIPDPATERPCGKKVIECVIPREAPAHQTK